MHCRYREDADKSIQDDIVLLSCGYILVIFYVSVMLGNFSRMNTKVSVSSSDFCLSSEARFKYGTNPVRSSGRGTQIDDKDN